MTDDIEVLVHISTSATRETDELFRSVANAYTEFRPHKTHRDRRGLGSRKASRAAKVHADASPPRADKTLTAEATDPLVPPARKDTYGSFSSYLSFDRGLPDHALAPEGPDRPVSRLAQLDRSYVSWRKLASPRASFRQGQEEPQVASDGPEDADTGFIEDSQTALQALQSQLEDTWSMTSADTSVDEANVSQHTQPSRETSSAGGLIYRASQEVSLPAPLRDHVHPGVEAGPPRAPVDPSESRILGHQRHPDTIMSQLDFSKIPIDALPPPPTITVASPVALPSQTTKHLAAIKTNNPSRFKPVRIRRSLETDERGYWRVDCTQWPPRTQQEFWSSLYENVRSGRIGWGTTLHRQSSSISTLGIVRLYCWGEVVEHMWLLLWLCSQGQITDVGSSWIDADGVAVVEMG